MFAFKEVHKTFPALEGRRQILCGVSFDIPEATVTTIFGPNGCGKTTLMNILGGLESWDSGRIEGGEALRDSLGFVFQDYRRSLLPWHDVGENILFPLRIGGVSRATAAARLEALLALTGLNLDLKQRVGNLSGGQAQMVCLLRALIIQPKLLVLDEPFSALDYERTMLLRQKLLEIAVKLQLTVLLISHDLEEALYLGDQVVFLSRIPTRVIEVLPVDLPKPRSPDMVAAPSFGMLKLKAIQIFEKCLRTGATRSGPGFIDL